MKLKINSRIFKILVIIGTELVLVLLLILVLHVKSLNSTTVIEYADKENADTIYAENGYLKINDIKVTVPKDNVEYGITYDWAEDDKEYPSVPVLASATYWGDNDELTQPEYEIMFYKSSFTPAEEIPENKTAANWFDDWEAVETDELEQRKYDSKLGSGFYIFTKHPDASEGQAAATYTYHFVLSTESGIEQYTIECNSYKASDIDKVKGIFAGCIDSLSQKAEA